MVAGTCNPSYSGGWGRRIAWTWEAEVAISRDFDIALQPGQQEWNSVSKKKKKREKVFSKEKLIYSQHSMYKNPLLFLPQQMAEPLPRNLGFIPYSAPWLTPTSITVKYCKALCLSQFPAITLVQDSALSASSQHSTLLFTYPPHHGQRHRFSSETKSWHSSA